MLSRQDKFGYYTVGNLKFYSKLEAIQAEQKFKQPVVWHFNDEVYNNTHWNIEPTESIQELYRQRAQQLRDQYDYLVLWFSGGADSANILSAFIEYDIKLDEVVSWVNYDATGDKDNPLNGEVYNFATKLVEKAQIRQPNLKHRIVDITKPTIDFYAQADTKFDWIYYANAHQSPNSIAKRDIALTIPEWCSMFDSGKRVAFIMGIDKPQIYNIKDQFYFKFTDMPIDGAVALASMQMLDRPWEFNELFYWTPDAPGIVVKQAHLLKRYIKATKLVTGYKEKDYDASRVQTVIDKKIAFMRNDIMHEIIYPWWEPNPWQAKSPSNITSTKDTWFFNIEDSNKSKYAWRIGIEEMWRHIPDQWRTHTQAGMGIKDCSSPLYCIGL